MPLSEVRLLAPVQPSKVLAAGLNYWSHVGSVDLPGLERPRSEPQLFLKPASSVIGSGREIVIPVGAEPVQAEGELVAVVGRQCRSVTVGEALTFVFGYTCGNDVSARNWQREDLQWWRAKGSDTFCPIGPYVATGLDPSNLHVRTRVNGAVAQTADTKLLIFGVAELVSFASRVMTLEPGDLIMTGTPGETPTLRAGDLVEVEIEGIGALSNPVIVDEGGDGRP